MWHLWAPHHRWSRRRGLSTVVALVAVRVAVADFSAPPPRAAAGARVQAGTAGVTRTLVAATPGPAHLGATHG
ncbi:MAG: hypothetical protein ACR2MN_05535 [Acidimicrobiales bacterium]